MKIISAVLVCWFYTLTQQSPESNIIEPNDQDWRDLKRYFGKNFSINKTPLQKILILFQRRIITEIAESKKYNFELKYFTNADLILENFDRFFKKLEPDLVAQSEKTPVEALIEGQQFTYPENVSIPKNIDWRERGAVTPVVSQKHCAGAWAMVVAGAIEGLVAVKTGKLQNLSAQQLLDCVVDNEGCNGGLLETGFEYVKDNGIVNESSYPYEAVDSLCRSNKSEIVTKIGDFVYIPEGDENTLEKAVGLVGPVAAGVYVTESFQYYGGAIFDDPSCKNTRSELNHAVLVVGYGQEPDGRKYWLLKNFYGREWGMDGYLKLAKDKGNQCGIASYAMFPIIQ